MKVIVGEANEAEGLVNNTQCIALLDTGSQVSTIGKSCLETLDVPLHPLVDLKVYGIGGHLIPYFGFVELNIKLPDGLSGVDIPVLLVPDDDYNSKVPLLI